MKAGTAFAVLTLLICITMTAGDAEAGLTDVSVGAYAGSNIPIAQDDAGTGGLWGIRGRIYVLSLLGFEPAFTFMGSTDKEIGENLDGTPIELESPELSSFSFNVMIGSSYYGTAGIGSTKVEIKGSGDSTETTYNFGGGFEIPVGPIGVDIGSRFFVIENGDGSRKSITIQAGVNYHIF